MASYMISIGLYRNHDFRISADEEDEPNFAQFLVVWEFFQDTGNATQQMPPSRHSWPFLMPLLRKTMVVSL